MSWKKVAFWAKFLYLLCTRTFVLGIEEPDGDFLVKRAFAALLFAAFLSAPFAHAQAGPVEGGHELQVWTGGGPRGSGSPTTYGGWGGGVVFGLVFAPPPRPPFLPCRVEDFRGAVPLVWVLSKTNTAY